uniref:Uncharacterized protein n=1 Tax=Arundo donax TaxID=35708 RepID=A0A0A9GNT5_ARUDO
MCRTAVSLCHWAIGPCKYATSGLCQHYRSKVNGWTKVPSTSKQQFIMIVFNPL